MNYSLSVTTELHVRSSIPETLLKIRAKRTNREKGKRHILVS